MALTTEEVSATEERPAGRDVTPVLIADAGGIRQRLRLPGNFVPEAFTNDLAGLFVLEWLPPNAPDRYRVRVVDLATGKPDPLVTRDKGPIPTGAEEEMRGDGRQAVLAPNRTVLYTLYTHQPDHQHTRDRISGRPGSDVHAFVHTLHLEQRWAYCVDLPHPFGEGPADGHAMAITPDGTRLYVVDVTSGIVAEISTEELTVCRTAKLVAATGPAYAVADGDRLFLGAGATVWTSDLAGLGGATARPVRDPGTGLVLSPDGRRLYSGKRERHGQLRARPSDRTARSDRGAWPGGAARPCPVRLTSLGRHPDAKVEQVAAAGGEVAAGRMTTAQTAAALRHSILRVYGAREP